MENSIQPNRSPSTKDKIIAIFFGKRYALIANIDDQTRYVTMTSILSTGILFLTILAFYIIRTDLVKAIIYFSVITILSIALHFLRKPEISLEILPIFPVSVYSLFCLYLFHSGTYNFWIGIWIFTFPVIAIFLCKMKVGIIETMITLAGMMVIIYTPFGPFVINEIRTRMVLSYVLLACLAAIYEHINNLKDEKEKILRTELAQERDVIQTMKDNLHQGIFLMDADLKILPQYSKPLISILSYYDSELEGKNFLDILAASLTSRQLQTMQNYFTMMFSQTKSPEVLEKSNPIYEFEYKIDNREKILSTRFDLIVNTGSEPLIIGIIQDISTEKEFEKELQLRLDAQQQEVKSMLEVIQVDPVVFQDFIEDTESNFTYINSLLKDSSIDEKQVVTKIFQNVHAMKSNALTLGLESFGKKLHALEDDIKAMLDRETISVDDILSLVVKLEIIMREKDEYIATINKIDRFKADNRFDSVLVQSLTKAVEKVAAETQKKVDLQTGEIDLEILGSKLRKPIKDILFQCVRNSIYHGIESADERVRKNKKPTGLLTVAIEKVDGMAEITFSDDGSGLDWEKIKTRYQELYPETKAVSKKELLASIFSPLFSTAEATSEVAGRGVGLSLVRDIVKENGGSIAVNSTELGLHFKFTMPIPA